jgi:hypothetical protein
MKRPKSPRNVDTSSTNFTLKHLMASRTCLSIHIILGNNIRVLLTIVDRIFPSNSGRDVGLPTILIVA